MCSKSFKKNNVNSDIVQWDSVHPNDIRALYVPKTAFVENNVRTWKISSSDDTASRDSALGLRW